MSAPTRALLRDSIGINPSCKRWVRAELPMLRPEFLRFWPHFRGHPPNGGCVRLSVLGTISDDAQSVPPAELSAWSSEADRRRIRLLGLGSIRGGPGIASAKPEARPFRNIRR